MAKSVIDIDDLTRKVNEILTEYENELSEGVAVSSQMVGKEVVKQLKSTSPKRPKGGEYAKSWKMQFQEGRLGSKVIVYNDEHYQLTHLLENGHANVDGGRTPGKPHIKPAEQKAIEAFEKEIEGLI